MPESIKTFYDLQKDIEEKSWQLISFKKIPCLITKVQYRYEKKEKKRNNKKPSLDKPIIRT